MSVTFRNLEQKYNGFTHPLVYIKVDGAKDTAESVYIQNVEITLTSGYECSCCTFDVIGSESKFEKDALQLDSTVKKYLKLGAKIEVYVGYDTDKSCTLVFTGYVTTVQFQLEGTKIFHTIEAMDCKVFLMNNLRSEVKTGLKKYSEAVTNVLKDYSVASSKTVDTTDELNVPIEQYNQSDYDFIVDLARRVNYLFFVDCGKVKFIKYASAKEVGVVLTPGSHLFRFQRMLTVSRQVKTVTVRNNNPKDPTKPIVGKAVKVDAVGTGAKSSSDLCKLVGAKSEITLIDNAVTTAQQAKTRAEAELARVSMQFSTGSFETVGVPEWKPGQFVKVEGMDATLNGNYFLTEVVHQIDIGKYHCICKFESNKA